jgi:hypothetical protein
MPAAWGPAEQVVHESRDQRAGHNRGTMGGATHSRSNPGHGAPVGDPKGRRLQGRRRRTHAS